MKIFCTNHSSGTYFTQILCPGLGPVHQFPL